jgi:hypothetical protein
MMNANAPTVYMQCSISKRQEKARWLAGSGLKSKPWEDGGDRHIVVPNAGQGKSANGDICCRTFPSRHGRWCWYCCLPPAPEDAPGHVDGLAGPREAHARSIDGQYVRTMTASKGRGHSSSFPAFCSRLSPL